MAAGTCARPTAASTPWRGTRPGAWGWPDYLGWDWKAKPSGIPIVNVPLWPGAAGQLHGDVAVPPSARRRPRADDPAGRLAAAEVAVWGMTRSTKGAIAAATTSRPTSPPTTLAALHRQAWLLGAGRAVQRRQRGWINGVGGCAPGVGGMYRLHHAGLPRQVHAVHEHAARRPAFFHRDRPLLARPSATPRRLTQELSLNQEPECARFAAGPRTGRSR